MFSSLQNSLKMKNQVLNLNKKMPSCQECLNYHADPGFQAHTRCQNEYYDRYPKLERRNSQPQEHNSY